jgi:hypothetical protein
LGGRLKKRLFGHPAGTFAAGVAAQLLGSRSWIRMNSIPVGGEFLINSENASMPPADAPFAAILEAVLPG